MNANTKRTTLRALDEATGEDFSPEAWFFEEVHSGKILALDADETENADMFRRAACKFSACCWPKVMSTDNVSTQKSKITP